MSRVTLRAYNPVEFDLSEIGGGLFESVDLSESKAEKIAEVEQKLSELSDEQSSEGLPLLWDWFDTILQSAGDEKRKPSTVLKAAWKAEKITPRQLSGLYIDLRLEIAKANAGPEDELFRQRVQQAIEEGTANGRPT